jgi:Predicted metal-dependent hydrolase
VEKTVEHPIIGAITLRKKRGLRRISIRIDQHERVILSMPYSVSTSTGLDFVAAKLDWIQKSLLHIRAKKREHPIFPIHAGKQTRSHALVLFPESRKSFRTTITDDSILFHFPSELQVESEEVQHRLKVAITKTLMVEAKELLPCMVSMMAQQHGFQFKQISIKNIHSRWGSCSSKNNLNFSIYLVLLPDHLIQYVVLHELCHTIEKNHGPGFWKLLDLHCGGKSKSLAKEMKSYTTRIF